MARQTSTVKIRAGRRTIEISRPDKVFFPKSGITKRELVEYYRDIAGTMGRHVTTSKCPLAGHRMLS